MSRGCDAFEPLLSAWVDGELRRSERSRVGAHLQRCARCRGDVRALRVTQSMLRSLPPRALGGLVDVPGRTGTPRRIHARHVVRAALRSALALLATAVLVSVAGFVAGSTPPSPDPPVAVPVDVYVADHLVHSVGGAVSTPAIVGPRR